MNRRRALLLVLLPLLALLIAVWAMAPPARRRLVAPADPRIARGAVHVHTTISDGAGTPDDVAAAASRAGLDFVVLTDHGDATRAPSPPRYVGRVLLVDAVEISTTGGHYIAIGLPQAPYRLAGEPRDVIEDVRRLGGFGVAAHPDSPKVELSWREWQAPFDGIEWLNADSSWRDERRPALARALFTYWLRAPEVIVSLFDRPERTLARWDALTRRRPVVGIAGHDAHARIGSRGDWEPADSGRTLRLPGYEAAFRAFSLAVGLAAPLTRRDAAADMAAILSGLRAGRVVTTLDGLAGPAYVELSAATSGGSVPMGSEVRAGMAATLTARLTPAADGATMQLLRDGAVAARSNDGAVTLTHDASAPAAVYRVEVLRPGAPGTPPVPWIVTNPIRVGFPPARPALPLLPVARWARPLPVAPWRVEQHPASATTLNPTILTPTNTAWTLEWRLGPGPRAGQYAAAAAAVPPGFLRDADRLSFVARSPRAMRISVQLRSSASGKRWQRSVYLSPDAARQTIAFRELAPADPAEPAPFEAASVDALLFVVDTVNTVPGSTGEIWISEVEAQGAR